MLEQELNNKLSEILEGKSSGYKITKEVFALLRAASSYAPQLLRRFFEQSEAIPVLNRSPQDDIFTKDEEIDFFKFFGKRGLFKDVDDLFQKNYDEDVFYVRLWNIINQSSKLKTVKQREFFLYCIWQNPRIPYFCLPTTVKMTDKEFAELWKKHLTSITKARFIVFTEFEQRTEEASELLSIMTQFRTKKEKAFFLAIVISLIEARTMKQMSNLSNDETDE